MNAPLLRRLRESAGSFVPIVALETISPDPIGDLDALAAFGFQIERHPILGACYRGPADRLCPDQIEDGVAGLRIGRRVAVWNRVGSTNDLAARAAHSTSNEGLVVVAEEQTAGRGRRGRAWEAPPRSSVLMSVLLFPEGPLADPAWLTALGAVAVAEVVRELTGRDARIKWPNDVRVGRRKVAGILVERGAGAVLGIGVNANLVLDDLPSDLAGTATSLRMLVGDRVDRSDVVVAIVRRLDALYLDARNYGPAAVGASWKALSEHVGQVAEVMARSGARRGIISDIDLFGGMTLLSEDGTVVQVPNADILAFAARD